MLIDDLKSDLSVDEGFRAIVYDDSTGKRIIPNTSVSGHPTIGYGRALDVHGISLAEAEYLLTNDAWESINWCSSNLSWFLNLDNIRQRAIANMHFQLGEKIMQFHIFLGAMEQSNWQGAYIAGKNSAWYNETPARAEKILQMILTGVRA